MDTFENAEITVSIRHITRFLKSGISNGNSEVRIWQAEKKGGEEEEHRQLEGVLHFTQTQQTNMKNTMNKTCICAYTPFHKTTEIR